MAILMLVTGKPNELVRAAFLFDLGIALQVVILLVGLFCVTWGLYQLLSTTHHRSDYTRAGQRLSAVLNSEEDVTSETLTEYAAYLKRSDASTLLATGIGFIVIAAVTLVVSFTTSIARSPASFWLVFGPYLVILYVINLGSFIGSSRLVVTSDIHAVPGLGFAPTALYNRRALTFVPRVITVLVIVVTSILVFAMPASSAVMSLGGFDTRSDPWVPWIVPTCMTVTAILVEVFLRFAPRHPATHLHTNPALARRIDERWQPTDLARVRVTSTSVILLLGLAQWYLLPLNGDPLTVVVWACLVGCIMAGMIVNVVGLVRYVSPMMR